MTLAPAFLDALGPVLDLERGWHPGDSRDPHPTLDGITLETWLAARGALRGDLDGDGDVDADDLRASTPEQRAAIYHDRYWVAGRCDELHAIAPEVALLHFDAMVQHGPGRPARAGVRGVVGAVHLLQRAVLTPDDGRFGPMTLAAVQARVAEWGVLPTCRRILEVRRDFYRRLIALPPRRVGGRMVHLAKNKNGWRNRVNRLGRIVGLTDRPVWSEAWP